MDIGQQDAEVGCTDFMIGQQDAEVGCTDFMVSRTNTGQSDIDTIRANSYMQCIPANRA